MNRNQRRHAKHHAAKRPQDAILAAALASHRAGDVAAAVAGYRRVLDLDPRNLDALMNLGHAGAAEGKQAEALRLYRRALAVAPRRAAVHRDLARVLTDFGRWDEAWAHAAQAIALEPDSAEAFFGLGTILLDSGRRAEAVPALERAVVLNPLYADGWVELARALFDPARIGPALDALTRAVASDAGHVWARFLLGVALDLAGQASAAKAQLASLHRDPKVFAGAVDSWRYVQEHRAPTTRLFTTTRETLLHALAAAPAEGLVVELGVRYGITTRWIAAAASGPVHGFDSFEGLPEGWHVQPKGIYSTHGEVPELPANVELHVGLFHDTLPAFLATTAGPLRFAHVDCDLYSSTRTVLEALGDRIVPGSVLLFDEYLINDAWREDEHKAFQEHVAARGLRYEYLAFGIPSGQAAVRVLG
jgi:tetratricopeptide (TPR) repeat protein